MLIAKCVGGWQRQLCSLHCFQAVGTHKFFGELFFWGGGGGGGGVGQARKGGFYS